MERRKRLATAGAVSLTATAAVIAFGASVGLFGLSDDSPRVGNLSPIDSTRSTVPTTTKTKTIIVDEFLPATPTATTPSSRPDRSDDPAGHDANDDDGVTTPTTPSSVPEVSDDRGDDDKRAPGSDESGADDSNHGSSSGSDHDDDD